MTWKPEPGMTAKQIEKELERQKILFEERCRTGRYSMDQYVLLTSPINGLRITQINSSGRKH